MKLPSPRTGASGRGVLSGHIGRGVYNRALPEMETNSFRGLPYFKKSNPVVRSPTASLSHGQLKICLKIRGEMRGRSED